MAQCGLGVAFLVWRRSTTAQSLRLSPSSFPGHGATTQPSLRYVIFSSFFALLNFAREAAKISFLEFDQRVSQEAEQFSTEARKRSRKGKKSDQGRHGEMENEEENAQYVEKGTGPATVELFFKSGEEPQGKRE